MIGFFGILSKDESEDKLAPYRVKGTYLVRLNPGTTSPIETCPYTISRVGGNNQFVHTRVQPSAKGGFFVKIEETNCRGSTLLELMEAIAQKELSDVSVICGGHPFTHLFEERQDAGGYELDAEKEQEEEDEDGQEEKEEKKPVKTPAKAKKTKTGATSPKKPTTNKSGTSKTSKK